MKRDFEQVFGQIVSVTVKTPDNTNLVASRHIKRGKGSLPVNMHQSKTSLLKRSIGCYKGARETGSHPPRHGAISHFRVPKTLTFKMRPSARPFLWKWVLFAREWKVISISNAEHLTSFWYRGPEELGNSLFEPIPTQSTSKRPIVKGVRLKSRYLIATTFAGLKFCVFLDRKIIAKFNTHKENSHHRKKCLTRNNNNIYRIRSTNIICVFEIVCVFAELKLVILVSSILHLMLWNNSSLQRFHVRRTESRCREFLKMRLYWPQHGHLVKCLQTENSHNFMVISFLCNGDLFGFILMNLYQIWELDALHWP